MKNGAQMSRGPDVGERVWLKQYPAGVPADIDVPPHGSLVDLMEESFARFGDRTAFICHENSITYREIDETSRVLAACLQSWNLPKGARIALMMPNMLQYPVALTAALRAGYTVVNANPLYTPRELEHQLKDSGAEAAIVFENAAATLQRVLDATAVKHVIVTSMADPFGRDSDAAKPAAAKPSVTIPGAVTFGEALAAGRSMTFTRPNISPDDVAFLQYTGGTTGVSKGATLLHRNVVANVLQADIWMQPVWRQPPVVDQVFSLCALPLYHIFGLSVCFLVPLRIGGVVLLITNPRDATGLVNQLARHRVNFIPGVCTLFNALLHTPGLDRVDFSMLKRCVSAGMATPVAVADAWVKATGCVLAEAYGLSETSPALTTDPAGVEAFTNSIGVPLPSTHISIRDDDGREVAYGEPGEICARGPQVMAGYWNRPEETAKVMTTDGYFRTGDIGIMDSDGTIRIVDRKKDMILVSGFNVYPNEIEGVIAGCPGVRECAVIGVKDARSGEAVKAFVVKKAKDDTVTTDDIVRFCGGQLTNYKIPKQIVFVEELPKTNVGKILRRELRDE